MNAPIEFMTPRLVGKRFEGHAIPFEVLKNLSILEDLVIEAAKWKYLKEHPERKRVPRGFTDGVSLQLTEVREGSAVPVIALTFLTTTPLIPEAGSHLLYYEQGRDSIFATVAAAEETKTVNAEVLPDNLLGYFDPLGRTLRDDEALELNSADTDNPIRLTKETRRRILLRSDKKELTEEVSLRGTVPEMDQEKMSFEFQVISGPRIKAQLESQYQESILEAFNGYRKNKRIQIQGIGRFDRSNKLQGISEVEHVIVLDERDPGARLDEFKALKNGWLDGRKGIAPDRKKLDWLSEAFESNYPDGHPLPYLYPTAEGGVQAEWDANGWELSLEINLVSQQGEWHALEMANEKDEEDTFDLRDSEGWKLLADAVAGHTGDVV